MVLVAFFCASDLSVLYDVLKEEKTGRKGRIPSDERWRTIESTQGT